MGVSLWQGTVRITPTSLDTLFIWSHCGGVYLDDAGKCEARRCADVFEQADMPRNGGGVYHKKVDEAFRRDASFRAYAAS